MTDIDVARARHQTPGCRSVLHFDNAGAALMPDVVVDATVGHLRLEAEVGGYEAQERSMSSLERVYSSAATLLNCQPNEIAVIETATRAWDMAFYSIPFKPADRILTAQVEYASNYIAFLQVARRTGAVVEVIPSDDSGQVSVDALRDMIDDRVKLIAVTHVPTNGGLVNPANEIGQVAREAGILYLLDACQSIGQVALDVQDIGCDFLSASARKYLRGPRGMGLLYVRHDVLDHLDPPFLGVHAAAWTGPAEYTMRADAQRFENWEANYAAKVGLGAALDYCLGWGVESAERYISILAEDLRGRLKDLPGVSVHDLGRKRCGIVSFALKGMDAGVVRERLRKRRINVSVSEPRCTLLDMSARELDGLVRASVHYYNTSEEVSRFVEAVWDVS